MSRLALLVTRPRRTLGALATVLAAAGLTAASGADFTAQSANPANTFSTGTLSMSNSADNAAVLTASNLRPGDPAAVGTVDIANSGSLSGAFTLTRGTPVDSDTTNPLSAKLNVVVEDCGTFSADGSAPSCTDGDEVTKYSGTLAEMGTAGHTISALGSYAAGDKHRYRFSVSFDGSAGNAYQGDSSTVGFTWNAA
jgi:spore coat-associated protein N